MSAVSDLRRAILEARANGLEVTEIHVSDCFYDAVCEDSLAIPRDDLGYTRKNRWFDGIRVKVADFEGTGFYLVCAPRVPKEPPEEPAVKLRQFCAGYPSARR